MQPVRSQAHVREPWLDHHFLLRPRQPARSHAPWHFGTMQIIKAVRNAAAIGVKHVITSEGDPKTEFGHDLTEKEALFLIRERLYEPLPHGSRSRREDSDGAAPVSTPTRSTTWRKFWIYAIRGVGREHGFGQFVAGRQPIRSRW